MSQSYNLNSQNPNSNLLNQSCILKLNPQTLLNLNSGSPAYNYSTLQAPENSNRALDIKSNSYCHNTFTLGQNKKHYAEHSIFLTEENTSYIRVKYQGIEFTFLLDTGANVSLIKLPKLKQTKSTYNPNEILTLNGLSANAPVQTIGSIKMNVEVYNKAFNIKFHIVKQETNMPFDGLIGNDFFKSENAEISFNKRELKIRSLPFAIPLHLNSNPSSSQTYFLNPRSETLVEIDIINGEIVYGICPEITVCEGVYLAKAIVKVHNKNKAFTTILNTNEKKVKVSQIKIALEPFNEHMSYVFNFNEAVVDNNSRIELLKHNLRLEHLNKEEKNSVLDICIKYNDIFYLPKDELTSTKAIQHKIIVTDPSPISSKLYRYPQIHKEEVNNQIKKMLKQGIIRPSSSPYCSPLWIVPKKTDASGEKKWRIVIDYRKLNEVTVGDSYPLPNIEEILDQLGHSKYFTTLDLASGFHQIEMHPDDIAKTAFSTPFSHYEFTRIPFGLKNSPNTFQRLMNTVLSGLQGLQCFVYLDDIVIYASSISEHSIKLKAVFDRLKNNNLLLQLDKCEFMRQEVVYLGHVISEKGVSPNPEKTKAISTYPTPKNVKQIKQFLGLVGYYRRFIKDFSKIAKPLTSLLKKNIEFEWSAEAEDAFLTFKNILTSEPLLQYPKFNENFILTTDSSNNAIGAVLSQGEVSKDLPIAYASRTLNKAEINYSTTEKELLAIV